MKTLTEKQAQIFEYVQHFQQEKGYPPTIREIGLHFALKSTGSVRDYLIALERKGFISRNNRTSRGIEVLQKTLPGKTMAVPVYGAIAAGQPLTAATDQVEDEIVIDSNWFQSDAAVFALRVKGESMIDSGILDGDLVIVKKQDFAEDGDIVAVVMDEDATVKYYYHEGKRIRFQPANEAMEPIYMSPDKANLHIAGKVVGVVRKY